MHAFADALVVCAREAGLEVAHEPAARRGGTTGRTPERTFTTPSRSSVVRSASPRLRWAAAMLVVIASVAPIALWLAREPAPASLPQRAEQPSAAQARAVPQPARVPTLQPSQPLVHAGDPPPSAMNAALATAATLPSTTAPSTGPHERSVATPAQRRPFESARRRRSPAAADPSPAAQVGSSFERRAGAGDLPVAVVW
jgi:hypothetical protein